MLSVVASKGPSPIHSVEQYQPFFPQELQQPQSEMADGKESEPLTKQQPTTADDSSSGESKEESVVGGSHRVMRAMVHEEVADSFIEASYRQQANNSATLPRNATKPTRKRRGRTKKTASRSRSQPPVDLGPLIDDAPSPSMEEPNYSLSLEILKEKGEDDKSAATAEQKPPRKSQPAKALDRERRPVNALNCAARHLLVGLQLARECTLEHIDEVLKIPATEAEEVEDAIMALEDEIDRLKRLHQKLFVVGYRLADALRNEGQSWLAARCLNDTLGAVLVAIDELLPSLPQLFSLHPTVSDNVPLLKPFARDPRRSLLDGWIGFNDRHSALCAAIVGDIASTLVQETDHPTSAASEQGGEGKEGEQPVNKSPARKTDHGDTSDSAALGGGWTEEDSDRRVLAAPRGVHAGSTASSGDYSNRRALENLPYLLYFAHLLRGRMTLLTRHHKEQAETAAAKPSALSELLSSISKFETPTLPVETPFHSLWKEKPGSKLRQLAAGRHEVPAEQRRDGWTAVAVIAYASTLQITERLKEPTLHDASQTV